MPSMLSYKVLANDNSLFKYVSGHTWSSSDPAAHLAFDRLSHSTPPTFAIYVCSLVLRSLLESPPRPLPSSSAAPLSPLAAFADEKSSLLYTEIDQSAGFYAGTADKDVRSRMNVTFRIKGGDEALEKDFMQQASERGIKGVNGHRSVGGTYSLRCPGPLPGTGTDSGLVLFVADRPPRFDLQCRLSRGRAAIGGPHAHVPRKARMTGALSLTIDMPSELGNRLEALTCFFSLCRLRFAALTLSRLLRYALSLNGCGSQQMSVCAAISLASAETSPPGPSCMTAPPGRSSRHPVRHSRVSPVVSGRFCGAPGP